MEVAHAIKHSDQCQKYIGSFFGDGGAADDEAEEVGCATKEEVVELAGGRAVNSMFDEANVWCSSD